MPRTTGEKPIPSALPPIEPAPALALISSGSERPSVVTDEYPTDIRWSPAHRSTSSRSQGVTHARVSRSRGEPAPALRALLPLVTAGLDVIAVAVALVALSSGDVWLALTASLITVVLLVAAGGYRLSSRMTADHLGNSRRLLAIAVAASWCTLVAAQSIGTEMSPFDSVVMAALLAVSLVGTRALIGAVWPTRVQRVVVVGAGTSANRLAALSHRHKERRFEVIGCLDNERSPWSDGDLEVIGRPEQLPIFLGNGQVDRVLVAFGSSNDEDLLRVLRECDQFGVPIDVLPRFIDLGGHQSRSYSIGCTPLQTIKAHELTLVQRQLKRAVDVLGAAMVLMLAAIPCLVIASIIKFADSGAVFYRQRRIGKDGAPFDLFKFRTMVPDADKLGDARIEGVGDGTMSVGQAVIALKQQDDPRITRYGRFLRATSLDELPQLFNVLRGEMSLVGPRPLRDFEHESLVDWQRDRERFRPGLTGLWQVSGRSAVGWEERLSMDYLYVRHWSLAGDVRILCETVPALLGRRGAQ